MSSSKFIKSLPINPVLDAKWLTICQFVNGNGMTNSLVTFSYIEINIYIYKIFSFTLKTLISPFPHIDTF